MRVEHEKKNTALLMKLLAALRRTCRRAGNIVLILDNDIVHESDAVAQFVIRNPKFPLLPQPVYYPWVGRPERLWKVMHDTGTRNPPGEPLLDLCQHLKRSCRVMKTSTGGGHGVAEFGAGIKMERCQVLSGTVSLVLLALLGACAPNAVTFYRPSVPGGEITTGGCVPSESRIDFFVHGMTIRAVANATKSGAMISLFLQPQSGQSVHFVSDGFWVRDTETGRRITVTSVYTSRSDGIESPSVPYPRPGERMSPLQFASFNVHVSFTGGSLQSFELLSPRMVINDLESELPMISFKKDSWVGLSPLNC